MKLKDFMIYLGIFAVVSALAMAIVFSSVAMSRRIPPRPPGPERWSKWSDPYDTTANGWYREHGVIQYRTNQSYCFVCRRWVSDDEYYRRHVAHQQYLKIEVNPIINKKLADLVDTGFYGSCPEEAAQRILCDGLQKIFPLQIRGHRSLSRRQREK